MIITEDEIIRLRRYSIALGVIGTFIILISLFWNLHQEDQGTRETARAQARVHLNKDQAIIYWIASHGGVYVGDEKTPPNPYLDHIPDRDIRMPNGQLMTLINPAHIVRQMSESFAELYGIAGRITSLKPLRPENKPDAWEKAALESFERGETEVNEFTEIDGQPFLRLMRPMNIKKSCLKCHQQQGYQEGDIQGGVGISLPLKHLLSIAQKHKNAITIWHGILWIIGISGLVVGSRRFSKGLGERKKAEDDLRLSEFRYRRLFEDSPIALWEEDLSEVLSYFKKLKKQGIEDFLEYFDQNPEGLVNCAQMVKIVDLNKAALDMYQAESKEELSGNLKKSFADEYLNVFKDKIITLANGERYFYAETVNITLAGELQHFELSYYAFEKKGDTDNSNSVLVSARNITTRKQVEEAFQTRARQQAVIAELGQLALSQEVELADLMNEIVNRLVAALEIEYCKILKLLPGGKEVLLLEGVGWQVGLVGNAKVPNDYKSQAGFTLISSEPVVVEDLKTETRFSGPQLLLDHNVTSGMSTIIEGDDGPWGVLGVHTTRHRIFTQDDVNFLRAAANLMAEAISRKDTGDALRESEQRWQFALEGSRDGVWDWNVVTNEIFYSHHWKKILGYEVDEISNSIDELNKRVHPDDKSQYQQDLEKHLNGESPFYENEHRMLCKDGAHKWILDRGKVIEWTKEKKPQRIIGTQTDITDRKLTEEQIKNHTILLEEAVKKKTAEMELMTERLVRQEKLATIGKVSGSIAHELRNPLGAVKQSVFFLQRKMGGYPAKIKEHLTLIDNELKIADRVISDLLAMTRINPAQKETIELGNLVQNAARRCHLEETISLETHFEPNPFSCRADPLQIQQVLVNLLTNSKQALPGKGTIEVKASFVDKRNKIKIEVADNGCGMKSEDIEKAFEPLFTTKAKGTGLGLSICKQIIENHDGEINLESHERKGTTVKIILPGGINIDC